MQQSLICSEEKLAHAEVHKVKLQKEISDYQSAIERLKCDISEQTKSCRQHEANICRLEKSLADRMHQAAAEKSLHDEMMKARKAGHKEERKAYKKSEKKLQARVKALEAKLAKEKAGGSALKNMRVGAVRGRMQRKRKEKCYEATMQLLGDIGRAYERAGNYSSQEEATAAGMKEIMTRAIARGQLFNASDWLPERTRKRLEMEAVGKVKKLINNPDRVAAALDAGPVTYGKLSNVLKVLLPEGRGWRPATARIVEARKRTTETMQKVLPIWTTPGGTGHMISVKRLLQCVIPWYCNAVEDMGFTWHMMERNLGAIRGSDVEESEALEDNPLLDANGRAYLEYAVSFDGRSHGKGSMYLTATLGSKARGFSKQWQSRDWVYTTCEVIRQDSSSNLENNCQLFWKEVQDLYEGEQVMVSWRNEEIPFTIKLTVPADMKAHWSLFRQGGASGNAVTGKPCHRCECTKAELDTVLDFYMVKRGDTPKSVASEHGMLVEELRLVNHVKGPEERAHKALHCQTDERLKKFLPSRVRQINSLVMPFLQYLVCCLQKRFHAFKT
eukprot:TRINITY_DN4760_c0_g4_i1.p1 TRINITY_DN4760_c0_g4~~TRINITY_DN4760_c0_g4_i1.p1  ORF type:complete len:558 (-),score=85.92 TRINITY_DN4760_c0_g4_i1:2498-4171(-)